MSTSADLTKHLSFFVIPQDIIRHGLNLVTRSESKGLEDHYLKHPTIAGGNLIYLELTLPTDKDKGSVRLLSAHRQKWLIPKLTSDIKNYKVREYLGHRVYIHPEHDKIGKLVSNGHYSHEKITICILLIKGKGAISFPV